MKKISIQMSNISKSYNTSVLADINISIDNSSYFAICGESGAGKSTFMNILGLIERFDSGEYIFNGKKIRNKRDYSKLRLENIGFIFQSYNLIPSLSCRENIMLPSLYCDSKKSDIENRMFELADAMKIMDLLDRDSNVLSGGEKQRVAIARALLLNPGLIIADEPTGNLDEKNKRIVLDILRKEHEKGRAVVVITHDLETANEAKKIFELKKGRFYEK